MGRTMARLSLCQRMCDPGPAFWFRSTPVGTFPLAHQGDKKGATLLHKTNNPIPDGVIRFFFVGPCNLTVSDHELCAFAHAWGDTVRRACTAPATQEAGGQGDEKAAARGATAAGAGKTHATPMDEPSEFGRDDQTHTA